MRVLLVMLGLCGLAASVSAQDTPGEYQGVVPGSSHRPSHLNVPPGSTPAAVTWPGFQANDNGSSRFFLESTGPLRWQLRKSGRTLTIVLENARLADGQQSMRPLETQFFSTPVTRAHLRRVRRELHFILELRSDVTPVINSEPGPNGYSFLFVNFPAGDYGVSPPARAATTPAAPPEPVPSIVTVPPPPTPTVRGSLGVRPSAPRATTRPADPREYQDNERPPGQSSSGNAQ